MIRLLPNELRAARLLDFDRARIDRADLSAMKCVAATARVQRTGARSVAEAM